MRKLQYRKFSLATHRISQNAEQPSVCQFELTFSCGLHCRHCYSDCYNKPAFRKKELSLKAVKRLLDKIRRQGVIWLSFTGGDPLARNDFPEIYAYAKAKGFLVSVFTNGYSLNKELIELFKRQPPFVIEMTLNAVKEKLYERISQVKGSFRKVVKSIQELSQERIPLKIKTLVTRDNVAHLTEIEEFLAIRGFSFQPDYHLLPRLNGDRAPCSLRVPAQTIIAKVDKKKKGLVRAAPLRALDSKLFWCALGAGQKFQVDPYGNLFLCPAIRFPAENILSRPIAPVFKKMLSLVREQSFSGNSRCLSCKIRAWCLYCPGKAYLENGDPGAPSKYYCQLTRKFLGR
jgi:radical SAM protein with 4Fe4S-binding SPASM domain